MLRWIARIVLEVLLLFFLLLLALYMLENFFNILISQKVSNYPRVNVVQFALMG